MSSPFVFVNRSMIKNIVFDVGNVLIKFEPDKMLAEYDLSEEEINAALKTVFFSNEWRECDRGIGWHDEVLPPLLEKLTPRCAAAVRDICFPRDFEQSRMPQVESMAKLMRSLREWGYKLYILSNFSFGFHTFAPHVKAFEYCEGLFASCDYRLLKPEKAIYEKFFEVFSLKPEECLFIDDTLANIEGSRAAGMDGIVFNVLHETADELAEKLKKYLN